MILRYVIPIIILSIITACDAPVNSNVKNKQDSKIDNGQTIERSKLLSRSKEQVISLQTPVFPIVMKTIRSLTFEGFETNNLDRNQVALFNHIACDIAYGANNPFQNALFESYILQVNLLSDYIDVLLSIDATNQKKKRAREDISALLDSTKSFDQSLLDNKEALNNAHNNLKEIRKLIGISNKINEGNKFDLAKVIFTDFDNITFPQDDKDAFSLLYHGTKADMKRVCAAKIIRSTIQPIVGWPSYSGIRNQEANLPYVRNLLASSITSSELLPPIIAELTSYNQLSNKEYGSKIREGFNNIVDDVLSLYLSEHHKDRQFSYNFTGQAPAPVHFSTSDGYDFQGGPHGSFLTHLGIEWFGKGYIQGVIYTIEVSYNNSAEINKSKSFTTQQSTEQEQSVTTEASTH